MQSFWNEHGAIKTSDKKALKVFKILLSWGILVSLFVVFWNRGRELDRKAEEFESLLETTQQTLKTTQQSLEKTQQILDTNLYFSNIGCEDVKLVNVIDRKNRSVHIYDRHVFPEFNFHVANKYFLVGDYEQAEVYYLKSKDEFDKVTKEQLAYFYRTNYNSEKLKDVEAKLNCSDERKEIINYPTTYKYLIYTNLYVNSLSLHSDKPEKQNEYHQEAVKYHDIHFKGRPDHKIGIK